MNQWTAAPGELAGDRYDVGPETRDEVEAEEHAALVRTNNDLHQLVASTLDRNMVYRKTLRELVRAAQHVLDGGEAPQLVTVVTATPDFVAPGAMGGLHPSLLGPRPDDDVPF
jgi:hypothetical protein